MKENDAKRRARRRRRRILRAMRITMLVLGILLVSAVGIVAYVSHSNLASLPAAPEPSASPSPSPTPMPTTVPATPQPAPTSTPQPTPTPAPRSARFRVTGDLMASETILKYGRKSGSGGEYDFSPMFAQVAPMLRDADCTIGNLETTIGKYKDLEYSGYPLFNTPESYLNALKDAGFDFLTLANNHMLDRYFDGMVNTVGNVEKWGFDHCGAYRTQEERDSSVIVEVGGIRFGFLSYTQHVNGMEEHSDPRAKEFGVPFLLQSDLARDIARLRQAGAEVVIVLPHWGEEYRREPDATERQYARVLAEAGADIILASHPHVLQKPEVIAVTGADGKPRETFVAYSLGNFVATQIYDYTDTGMILDFTVREQPDGTFAVTDVGCIPTYIWRQDGRVTVVPSSAYLDQRPEGMSKETYRRMRKSYEEAVQLMDGELAVLTK